MPQPGADGGRPALPQAAADGDRRRLELTAPAVLARLMLTLLMVLAAPTATAMPACHETPAASAHEHHERGSSKAVAHESLCIGCIAPALLHPPVLARAPLAAGMPPTARKLDGLTLAALPPATPPPRRG